MLDADGRLIQRRYVGEAELAFWQEVQFWEMFPCADLRVWAKSRRLAFGGTKKQLAGAIAAHETFTKALEAGDWAQAAALGPVVTTYRVYYTSKKNPSDE